MLTNEINSAQKEFDAIDADVVTTKAESREEFLEELRSGKFEGVSVIFRTFASVEQTGRFDKELIDLLPSSVKFLCHNGMAICITILSL